MRIVFNFLLCSCVLLLHTGASRPPKPHIIYILADDLGWGDVGYHGGTQVHTPNIDALAGDSVILENYYACAQCTPSRAALLTGRYPSTIGLQKHVIPSSGPWGLPLEISTLANKLGSLGYINRFIGKWHLGFYKSEYLPTSRGFHSHFGIWTGKSDFFFHDEKSDFIGSMINIPDNTTYEKVSLVGHTLRCNRDSRKDLKGKYLTDLFTEEAVMHISSHNTSQPLFILLAHHAPHRGSFHRPMRAPEEYTKHYSYIKDETTRTFAGAVTGLDMSVGKVIDALYRKDMLSKSVVIFTSDNGADIKYLSSNGGSNWPLRGQKFSPWEGGVRVPAFIWSPMLPNPGRIWKGMAHVTDWFPTLYSLAGGDVNDLSGRNGHDLWEAIAENKASPRNETLIHADSSFGVYGLRVGKYKIIKGSFPYVDVNDWYGGEPGRSEHLRKLGQPESLVNNVLRSFRGRNSNSSLKVVIDCGEGNPNPRETCDVGKNYCLFNMEDDPCEYHNMAENHTEILRQLVKILDKYKTKDVPPLNVDFDYLANPAFYGNAWTPWRDPPGKTLKNVPACNTANKINNKVSHFKNDSNSKRSQADSVKCVLFLSTLFVVYIFRQPE